MEWANIIQMLISAALSLVGVLVGARLAGKWQMQSTAMTAFVQARLTAYGELEAALKDIDVKIEHQTSRKIFAAINAAYLVASPETFELLKQLNLIIRITDRSTMPSTEEFYRLRRTLIESMRNDIFSYPVPKKEKVSRSRAPSDTQKKDDKKPERKKK
jgi:hypothetical protein|nr:MAG TPA_asm: hypothetical protein [Caudoviricetes sp.]